MGELGRVVTDQLTRWLCMHVSMYQLLICMHALCFVLRR